MLRGCLLSTLLLSIGCTSGTETGNPLTAELSVSAHTTDPAIATLGTGVGIVVDAVWASLGDVTFFPAGACTDVGASEIVIPPTAGELVSGIGATSFTPERSSYCRVEVPFHPGAPIPEGAPAELDGNTIVVSGTRADGTAFRIVTGMILRAEIRGPMDQFGVDETRRQLVVALDVATWLSGIDFTTLVAEADGTILIDAAHNTDALTVFETNALRSADLYHDANGNGHVDSGEEQIAVHH